MVTAKTYGGRAIRITVGITALVLVMAGGASAATLTVNYSGNPQYNISGGMAAQDRYSLTVPNALSETELAYDDGSAEGSWAIGSDFYPWIFPPSIAGGSDGHAVKFSPDSTPFTINTIKVFGRRYGDDGKIRLEIWDQNKNILYSNISNHSDYFTPIRSWAYIKVPDIIISGDFYVVLFTNSYIPYATPTTGIYTSYDNSSSINRSYRVENYNVFHWTLSTPQETTNWMIRVVGTGTFTPTPTVSPTPTPTPTSTPTPSLVFAITPNSRNAQVGTPVTIFMSVINGGTATATGVSITQASSLPATVSYQQWNGATLIGSPNTAVDIPAGGTANFVLTINATSAFNSSSLTFNVSGTNAAAASISGVNTLTISASTTPLPDIIMMATGTLDYRTGVGNATAFAVATSNIGATATGVSFNVVVPSSITGLVTQVNQTNPTTGAIIGPATGLTINVGATPTFAVFLTPTQPITLDLVNNRIVLQLVDGTGKIIGAQSVAVSTT